MPTTTCKTHSGGKLLQPEGLSPVPSDDLGGGWGGGGRKAQEGADVYS